MFHISPNKTSTLYKQQNQVKKLILQKKLNMIVFPNAKINLGLNVVSKRPDGYHNLETIFVPIPLSDILEITHWKDGSSAYQWSCSGIEIDTPPESNIIIKALQLIKQDFEIPPIQIHLHKHIPFGAGLGGGSADAAFMLKLLNNAFELNISNTQLVGYAAKLGADCPFFIHNQPAYATGIGDKLSPIELNLKGYYLTLIKPNIHVSTIEAYSGITPQASNSDLNKDILKPVSEWKHCVKNDFEHSVFSKHPTIKEIKDQLYKLGAEYASMSGSGSTVFGLFKDQPQLNFKEMFIYTKQL